MRLMIDDQYEQMPWNVLDSVVFDVGDVLLIYSPQDELEYYFPGQREKQARIYQKMIRSPYWNMLDHGTLTVDEAVIAMTGWETSLKNDIRVFLEHFLDFNTINEEGVAALKACRAHGKKTYVLSNYQDKGFDRVEREYPFFSLFDGKIVSAKVKRIKPNLDIYRCVIETYGLVPERTLFIDDAPSNIEGALYAGWQGFCFNEPGKLRRFIGE